MAIALAAAWAWHHRQIEDLDRSTLFSFVLVGKASVQENRLPDSDIGSRQENR